MKKKNLFLIILFLILSFTGILIFGNAFKNTPQILQKDVDDYFLICKSECNTCIDCDAGDHQTCQKRCDELYNANDSLERIKKSIMREKILDSVSECRMNSECNTAILGGN